MLQSVIPPLQRYPPPTPSPGALQACPVSLTRSKSLGDADTGRAVGPWRRRGVAVAVDCGARAAPGRTRTARAAAVPTWQPGGAGSCPAGGCQGGGETVPPRPRVVPLSARPHTSLSLQLSPTPASLLSLQPPPRTYAPSHHTSPPAPHTHTPVTHAAGPVHSRWSRWSMVGTWAWGGRLGRGSLQSRRMCLPRGGTWGAFGGGAKGWGGQGQEQGQGQGQGRKGRERKGRVRPGQRAHRGQVGCGVC